MEVMSVYLKKIALVFFAVLLSAVCAHAKAKDLEPNCFYPVTVERVVDGDTIIVRFDGGERERVRMIGVNTPESVDPNRPVEHFGKEASAFTKNALGNKTVLLQTDVGTRDRHSRVLAYIWTDIPDDPLDRDEVRRKMFNARLLLNGYAQVMTVQPNTLYTKMFIRFQREARRNSRGLWRKKSKQDEA